MTPVLVEPIEGIDLEKTPPCGILKWWSPCGKPSAFRIKGTCEVHGSATAFICAECHQSLSVRSLMHTGCSIPVRVTGI